MPSSNSKDGGGGDPKQDEITKGIEQMYKIYDKLNNASEKTTVSQWRINL
jgi:hypothetical protein